MLSELDQRKAVLKEKSVVTRTAASPTSSHSSNNGCLIALSDELLGFELLKCRVKKLDKNSEIGLPF